MAIELETDTMPLPQLPRTVYEPADMRKYLQRTRDYLLAQQRDIQTLKDAINTNHP